MKRIAFTLFAALMAVSCTTIDQPTGDSQTPRQRYTGEIGESAVGVIPDSLIRDNDRNREFRITIEYPTRSANNPLIIFSHGFGGSNRSYVALSAYWASQGYVVIKPAHADGNPAATVRSLEEAWQSQGAADWANRVRDLSFILDSLDSLEQRYPELVGKIDRDRIGVGGHSYGAHTAMLIGGARTFPGGTDHADPRVKAIVMMSPQGPGELRGLTSESFATIGVPALFMTGGLDRGGSDTETPQWRSEAFRLAPAGDKWLTLIEGASHASFTGRRDDILEAAARREEQMRMPDRDGVVRPAPQVRMSEGMFLRERDVFNSIKVLSLAFWDTYLRADDAGREVLERTRGGVTIERR
ncbi:MAG TPA: alpha/beta fold hydrolase [Thermoanaerobaculia bacterium]